MWPGLVGKGSPGAEPCLDLDTMLNLTAQAEVDGVKFDGVDIFLFEPHINIDISEDDLRRIADKIMAKGLAVGSVVAPIWPPTGGGSAMGSAAERAQFVQQVRKGCRIAALLRAYGARPYGVVRVDTACSVTDWDKDPAGNTQLIAQTLREACDVAESFGERLAAEGEICWGGLQSWKEAIKLLEAVNRPKTLGFQADMAHTLLYLLGYNKPEDALLPPDWDWSDPARFDEAYRTLTAALRPWTFDFHVAQNDATVLGSGTHEKTGHHCLASDPKGKLDIARHAGFWMRDEKGEITRKFQTICWDGCMFPNAVMMELKTWNDILSAMMAVRAAHGWSEPKVKTAKGETVAEVLTRVVTQKAAPKKTPPPIARTVKAKSRPLPAKPVKTAAKKASKPAAKPITKTKLAMKTKQNKVTPMAKPTKAVKAVKVAEVAKPAKVVKEPAKMVVVKKPAVKTPVAPKKGMARRAR